MFVHSLPACVVGQIVQTVFARELPEPHTSCYRNKNQKSAQGRDFSCHIQAKAFWGSVSCYAAGPGCVSIRINDISACLCYTSTLTQALPLSLCILLLASMPPAQNAAHGCRWLVQALTRGGCSRLLLPGTETIVPFWRLRWVLYCCLKSLLPGTCAKCCYYS